MQTTVIAELGINHNGSLEITKKLIETAKMAGADLIKFQKRDINSCYTEDFLNSYRKSPWGTTQRIQKESLEFGEEAYNEIDKYCKEINIQWFASAWDLKSVDFLEKFNVPYYKIPSALLSHKKLLEKIASLKKRTFISTGMSVMTEINQAILPFKKLNTDFVLMHCNSSYPCSDEDLNMLMILKLKEIFPDISIGYSGHSPGIMDGIIAVVLGAVAVEKHVTINRTLFGTDQSSSLEIHGLAKMIEYIRYVEKAMGDGVKTITEAEWIVRNKLWREKDYE